MAVSQAIKDIPRVRLATLMAGFQNTDWESLLALLKEVSPLYIQKIGS